MLHDPFTRLTMKKALIAIDLMNLYMTKENLLDRANINILSAASNDAFLKVHEREKVDLIVTRLDMPGSIKTDQFLKQIRQHQDLRNVSVIIICEDKPEQREKSQNCGANAVFTIPVDIDILHAKTRQFLSIAPRQPYREMFQIVDIEGKFGGRAFFGHGENLSTSGMLFKTENVFAKGDQIHFSFFLPGGIRVRVRGEVKRNIMQAPATRACLYGVQFKDLDPHNKSAIEMFVQKKK
jgi:DNA-binding response OmpR family regulator